MSIPTGNTGWFPRYSPDTDRVTWERPNYWQAQWFDGTTEIAQNGTNIVINGIVTSGLAPNELSAGGRRWAGFRPDPVRVYTSWGVTLSGAGCPTLNPDGLFGYVDDRQAATKNLIWDGRTVSRGAITDVRASRQALVWSDGGRTWGLRLDRPDAAADIQAAPTEFRPIPIDTPSGPWVLNHTHVGIIVRPFGETQGYRFDNGGQTFYPDARYTAGTIVAIFTNDAGVQSTQAFDLQAPRVDLGGFVVPVPPIDFPPQFPEEPPMAFPPQIFNRLDVVVGVNRDYPGLIRSDGGGFCDQVAHRLNKIDRVQNWGRKRKNDGSFNDDVVTWRIGPTDAQKHLVDTIAGDARVPVWDARPESEEAGNGTWALPQSADRDTTLPPDPPPSTDLAPRVAALERQVSVLQAQVGTLQSDVATLTARLNAVQLIDIAAAVALVLQGYEVNGNTSRTLAHGHTVRLPIVRRP